MTDSVKENAMPNKISNLRIIKIQSKGTRVAIASFIFEDKFYFGGVEIHAHPKGGYRLSYPVHETSTGNIHLCYPINKGVENHIEDVVTSAYEENFCNKAVNAFFEEEKV